MDSLSELGYARTTTAEISRRTGISQGGLFRHFPSRPALIVAAAEEVRDRQLVGFRAGLEQLGEVGVEDCLRLLRQACRAPVNAAWYELLVAARTDGELRVELAPMVARYHAEIVALGRSLPIAAAIPAEEVDSILMSVVHLLDGEALTTVLCPHPEQEERRLEHLVRILAGEAPWPGQASV